MTTPDHREGFPRRDYPAMLDALNAAYAAGRKRRAHQKECGGCPSCDTDAEARADDD
jgi:hypothetical protein